VERRARPLRGGRLRSGRPGNRAAAAATRCGGHDLRERSSTAHDVEHRRWAMGAIQRLRSWTDDGSVRRAVRSRAHFSVAAVSGPVWIGIRDSVDRELQPQRYAVPRWRARTGTRRRGPRPTRTPLSGPLCAPVHDDAGRNVYLPGSDVTRVFHRRRAGGRPRLHVERRFRGGGGAGRVQLHRPGRENAVRG
jgi:hypothetical protein